MHALALILAPLLVLATLLEGFETILLPRRVNRRLRFSRLYYRSTWRAWRAAATLLPPGRAREAALGVFGPLSLLGLFASWMLGLILAFAALHWGLRSPMGGAAATGTFTTDLYFSGTTFFTLGLGDVTPAAGLARGLTVVEGGLGLGFLAIIVGYLPVLYAAFSRREVTISLLDARAGSPPTGGAVLARLAHGGGGEVGPLLREWEQWSAELLESHISFPVLAFYRSQHANQSWLAAMAAMLDTCALLLADPAAPVAAGSAYQAQLTFAMGRHAVVDLTLIFGIRPTPPAADRFPPAARAAWAATTVDALAQVRSLYEPFLEALAAHLVLTLPPVAAAEPSADNWQRSAFMPPTPGIGRLAASAVGTGDGHMGGDHFD